MSMSTVQNYIIGIILFVIIITGGVYTMGSFYSYDNTLDSSNDIGQFNATLNKAAEVTSTVNSIDASIKSVSGSGSSSLGWLNALIGSVFSGFKTIGQSLGFMSVAIHDVAAMFGIPDFIVSLIGFILTVIIGFAIWAAIMKVNI